MITLEKTSEEVSW